MSSCSDKGNINKLTKIQCSTKFADIEEKFKD